MTFRALADAATGPADLRRPGHVFPVCALPGGVLQRPGYAEAAVDLLEMAGRPAVGMIAELVAEDGDLMRGTDLVRFASARGVPVLTIKEVQRYRFDVGHSPTKSGVDQLDRPRRPLTRAV